jgi:FkbM family methyltransferase
MGCAVGATEGESVFFSPCADGMSRLGAPNKLIADRTKETTVVVTTLDAYTAKTGIDPNWLLIDIEGFEIRALLGARDLVRRRTGKLGIVVEMHPNVWGPRLRPRENSRRMCSKTSDYGRCRLPVGENP